MKSLASVFEELDKIDAPITIADPMGQDCPLIYANRQFCDLTGYDYWDILGRNCRFLQGPGTDRAAVSEVRRSIAAQVDVQACLLNYRKDGTPFHNYLIMSHIESADDGRIIIGCQYSFEDFGADGLLDSVRQHSASVNRALDGFASAARHDATPAAHPMMRARHESAVELVSAYMAA